MNNYMFFISICFFSTLLYPHVEPHHSIIDQSIHSFQTPKDRKLSTQEVQSRGIDLMVTEIINNHNKIDLNKMARSSIFETSYGFRWKMVNLHTGKIIIIKVNKDFEVLSIREQ